MKKAFSLFTPLVGTGIVIMAILVSVTMMQNDARIAKGLTKSYEISAKEITAKLIKASAEVGAIKAFKKSTRDYFENPVTGLSEDRDYECPIGNNCYLKAKSGPSGIEPRLKETLESYLFTYMIGSIEKVVDKCDPSDPNDRDCFIPGTMDLAVLAPEEPITITLGTEDLEEKINSGAFVGHETTFSIIYIDDRGNSIQVSIVPEGFGYTEKEVGNLVKKTAEVNDDFRGRDLTYLDDAANIETLVKTYLDPADYCHHAVDDLSKMHRIRTCKDDADNTNFEIEWLEEGRKYDIGFPNCHAPTGLTIESAECVCVGGTISCSDLGAVSCDDPLFREKF